LKFCLDSEFEQSRILNISISKKTKFFSILYADYNLEVYNLTEEKRVNHNCNCMNELLKEEIAGPMIKSDNFNSTTKRTIKEKAKGMFSFALTKIKGIVFEKNRKSFCKYKFHPDGIDEDMLIPNYSRGLNQPYMETLSNLNVCTVVQFDKINEIVRFNLNIILL
jgi:hypothetical protein